MILFFTVKKGLQSLYLTSQEKVTESGFNDPISRLTLADKSLYNALHTTPA